MIAHTKFLPSEHIHLKNCDQEFHQVFRLDSLCEFFIKAGLLLAVLLSVSSI